MRIAVLGAGPIGIETATAAADAGHSVTVFEAGPVGASMRSWGHVRMFTPWRMNTTPLGRSIVGGAVLESNACPTGADLVTAYLEPLARWIDVRTHHRVVGVARTTISKNEQLGSRARAADPFRLLLEGPGGETAAAADVVLDCTGTFTDPGPVGAGGLRVPGEAALARRGAVLYGPVPIDATFAGQHIAVIGDGASAATVLIHLLALTPAPRITWFTRAAHGPGFHSPDDDSLPQRSALYAAALSAPKTPAVRHRPGERITAMLSLIDERIELRLAEGEHITVDRVIGCTGFRPDLSLLRELQMHVCWASEGPMKLAGALLASSGSSADCLDVAPQGPESLRNPEPGLFVLGSKSYGRRSDFLLATGHAQITGVLELLAADQAR
jgi:thioredoxin reductase